MYKDTVLAIAQGNGYRDVVFLGIYKGMDVYFPIGGENENREGIPEYITVTFSKNSDEDSYQISFERSPEIHEYLGIDK